MPAWVPSLLADGIYTKQFHAPTSQGKVVAVEELLKSWRTPEKETSQMMASANEAMSMLIQVEGTEQINKLRLQN